MYTYICSVLICGPTAALREVDGLCIPSIAVSYKVVAVVAASAPATMSHNIVPKHLTSPHAVPFDVELISPSPVGSSGTAFPSCYEDNRINYST